MRGLAGTISLALVVGGLAACGGSDSGSGPSATSGASSASGSEAAKSEAAQSERSQKAGDASEGKASRAGLTSDSSGSPSKEAEKGAPGKKAHFKKFKAVPLHVSGGGSEQFVSKGGDNSIQEFGEEASDELAEAAEALHNYYVAFSNDDWATACSYLSKSVREGFENLGSSAGEPKMSCEEVSSAFYANRSSEARRELTKVDAVSLRRDGDQAFLIYHGAEYDTGGSYGPADLYAMSMKPEDGGWKMGLAVGTQMGIPKSLER